MIRLDPIISEFATQEEADAYDKWFREQVETALKEDGPWIPHEQVMAEAKAIIAKHVHANPDLAA